MLYRNILENALHARIQEVCQWGPTLTTLYVFVNEWKKDPNTRKAGHNRPASETPFKMAFRWRTDDGQTLNAGLEAL